MQQQSKVILIGGPSNTGKSTLAQNLAERLGYTYRSTDRMARYPGRPWGTVPPHVVEHYQRLSPEELIEDVIRHYRSMWPDIQRLILAHADDPAAPGLVLEGSALWPETVATLSRSNVAALWLTADEDFLRERIYRGSGYTDATSDQQQLIDIFVERTRRNNERTLEAVARLHLHAIDIRTPSTPDELAEQALQLVGLQDY